MKTMDKIFILSTMMVGLSLMDYLSELGEVISIMGLVISFIGIGKD